MSRSNNTELISPVTRTFQWAGSEGVLKYYDKTLGEDGEKVTVKLPFGFLVLDRLATIRGFSDHDQSGYWANEVRNTTTDILTVRTKKGIVAEGLYKSLTGIMSQGAKYCQALYIAYFEGTELTIGKFEVSGSAIGSWIEACKGKDIYKFAFKIESAVAQKKGATNYFVPVYKAVPVSEETDKKAIELDKALQEYLTGYFKRNNSEVTPHPVVIETAEVSTQQAAVNASNDYYKPIDKGTEIGGSSNINDITEPIDDLPF